MNRLDKLIRDRELEFETNLERSMRENRETRIVRGIYELCALGVAGLAIAFLGAVLLK